MRDVEIKCIQNSKLNSEGAILNIKCRGHVGSWLVLTNILFKLS